MEVTIIITVIAILLGVIFPKSKICSAFLITLIYILFAFEHSEGDYEGYLMMYDSWETLDTETMFLLLSGLGHRFSLTFDQLRYIVCLLELLIISKFIIKHSIAPNIVLSSFLVFPAFMAAELFRWLMGMSIVILGLNYLIAPQKRIDYYKYFFCVVIAALSHSSCWFFLIYYLLLIKDRKSLIVVVLASLIVFLLLGNFDFFFDIFSKFTIREHLIDKYETGLYSNKMGIILALLKVGLIILVGWLTIRRSPGNSFHSKGIYHINSNQIIVNNERIFNLLIISSLMLIPMFFSSVSARLLHIPLLLLYISYSNMRHIKSKRPICLEPLLIAMLFLVLALFVDTNGLGPIVAFTSHFREGYLINFYNTIF